MLAACGGSAPAGSDVAGSGTPDRTPTPSKAVSTQAPAAGSEEPVETPVDAEATGAPVDETEPPAEEATPEPSGDETSVPESPGGSPTAEASGAPAGSAADACSGSDKNREFLAAAARAVDWDVVCAVLPKGWFVSSGSYRLANGGKLLIGYKGPGGATLSLSEGAFCGTGDGCVPAGSDLGPAAIGPLGGTLVGLDAGGYAIVVDRGSTPSWLLVTSGLDQATTVGLGAAATTVGD